MAMTQFNFTTNIEHRMPDTGKMFCIDRMTSDYAEQHPLDVEGFIESVYQEFAGTEFEESRETLRSIWTAALSVTSPRGDASLYPNKNGTRRAAAMKVWAKAGDYWRRGLRLGDTLPDIVPMCRITRLDDGGWIALFLKDAYLIDNGGLLAESSGEAERKIEKCTAIETFSDVVTTEERDDEITTEAEVTTVTEPAQHQEPRQLDLFAFEQLRQENERLQAQIAQMQAQRQAEPQRPSNHGRPAPARRQRQQPVTATAPITATVSVASPTEDNHAWLKTAGYLVAVSVALLLIWQTGLIIPLGLIGLATSGFLK